MVLLLVAETAPTSPINPGLGATVPTPPAAVLIAGWVLGIVTLAVLWAASRR